jgi:hypothetical protein
MFTIIESARMMVGTKAIATLSTGYLNALEYAKNRVQGADLTQQTDKTAPRVTITHHPGRPALADDAEGVRGGPAALVLYTAAQQDAVKIAQAAGAEDDLAERLNDFLLPLVKGCGSERAWVLLGSESLQTFGGSGLPQGLPDRAVRPRRQDRHPLRGHDGDPGPRLLLPQDRARQGPGAGLPRPADREFAKADPGDGRLAAERELLTKALDDVQGIVGYLVGQLMASDPRGEGNDPRTIYKVGQNTTRLLLATGDLVVGWLLLRQADVATTKLAGGRPERGGRGVLPGQDRRRRSSSRRPCCRRSAARGARSPRRTDNDLMDLAGQPSEGEGPVARSTRPERGRTLAAPRRQ